MELPVVGRARIDDAAEAIDVEGARGRLVGYVEVDMLEEGHRGSESRGTVGLQRSIKTRCTNQRAAYFCMRDLTDLFTHTTTVKL